jgi:hypothetical protein
MKTFASILFVAALATVLGACPNQCSGHGRCGENDKCECFRQKGTNWRQRVGWTGADCSQRTCPLGTAWDAISTKTGDTISIVKVSPGFDESGGRNTFNNDMVDNLNVKVSKASTNLKEDKKVQMRIVKSGNDVYYQWKYDTDAAYGAENLFIDTTGGNDYCTADAPCELVHGNTDTNMYVWFTERTHGNYDWGNIFEFDYTHQEGAPYFSGDSNSAHQHIECSGRGTCDRGSGQCSCFVGYSGEACQRTSCPSDCSGHGICQDLRRFADDANVDYASAYDAYKHMGCLCDAGFRGNDCSQVECPSGEDPMGGFGGNGENADGVSGIAHDCSGRGLCDYSNGLCQCFKGYFGERCEYQTNFV